MNEPDNSFTLTKLIEKLNELFDHEKVNVDEVQDAMETYQSNLPEWKKYAHFDDYRYTRNLVDSGNGKFNLILLCWGEGHGSGIHDHANSHCWMKVMDGTLTEKLYDWPNEVGCTANIDHALMTPRRVKDYTKNQVAYIHDTIGLHRIENKSHTQQAVSLHLYSPPFNMCHSFDERTGKVNTCEVVFWSRGGIRTPNGKINQVACTKNTADQT
ncbi:cysteine dioxygenase type 1 isoform X2 [Hydra vulgaris]|uniref:Cysteine dioxygenase n=1 Tax=Hydra vulgaris TaxID=6087 RepID=A0ABM4CHB1_HYDVU